MSQNRKKQKDLPELSSSFATGGGGHDFENDVQTAFVVMMLCGVEAPILNLPITKIQLQGRYKNIYTDDLIIYTNNYEDNDVTSPKLLIQVKHSISFTKSDKDFKEVIKVAWTDYKKANLFNKDKDQIAVICKQLSKTDIQHISPILDIARTSENAKDFFNKTSLASFFAEKKRKKLEVFRNHIDSIGEDASDEDIFQFLKCFHILGSDFNAKHSINVALLKTVLERFHLTISWGDLCKEVQYYNSHAGVIVKENFIQELDRKGYVRKEPTQTKPDELKSSKKPPSTKRTYPNDSNTKALALANLIGSWNENYETDKGIISNIVGEEYEQWIKKIRYFLHEDNSPISLQDGIWQVNNRKDIWKEKDLASYVFDEHLEQLKTQTLIILKEKDPKFDLPKAKRWEANLQNKVLTHSDILRHGISETLALIGNRSNYLTKCSTDNRLYFTRCLIRKVFKDADWILWGSLDSLLPNLAESNPEMFLEQVTKAIQTNSLFERLLDQEDESIFSDDGVITELLWALERLAWDERWFSRSCMVLADLAQVDRGGMLENRSTDSLNTILLPWLPRTNASMKKQQGLVNAIYKKYPILTWNILLPLLSESYSRSTSKPIWLEIKIDEPKKVLRKDYWEQSDFYAHLAISMAKNDIKKLNTLLKNIRVLTDTAQKSLFKAIFSNKIINEKENKRLILWNSLSQLITDYNKYKDMEWWNVPQDIIESIQNQITKIEPKDLLSLHQRLFINDEYQLFESDADLDKQRKKLFEDRQQAVQDIFDQEQLPGVMKFATRVENSNEVGRLLPKIDADDMDALLLPKYLDSNDKLKSFIIGYVLSKWEQNNHWKWWIL